MDFRQLTYSRLSGMQFYTPRYVFMTLSYVCVWNYKRQKILTSGYCIVGYVALYIYGIFNKFELIIIFQLVDNRMSDKPFKCKVSSVLNRNVKEYGKNYMFDNNDETCWSSDQGSPQWIDIQYEQHEKVELSTFAIQFQGGFVGKDCYLEVTDPESSEIIKHPFYPEDINNLQHFKLSTKDNEYVKCTSFRFMFNSSTDFFGRIVIYKCVWK